MLEMLEVEAQLKFWLPYKKTCTSPLLNELYVDKKLPEQSENIARAMMMVSGVK